MAAMPREAVNDVLELGGALATGAGLHYFAKQRPSTDDIVPLVVDLVASGAGVFGAMSLRGPMAFVAEGVATAGAAMAGARLVDMFQAQRPVKTSGRFGRFGYRAYSYPSSYAYSAPVGSNAVIEI